MGCYLAPYETFSIVRIYRVMEQHLQEVELIVVEDLNVDPEEKMRDEAIRKSLSYAGL